MTVEIHPVQISDAIAGFTISGVNKIYKLSEMPNAVAARALPVMLPAPTFVTSFNLEDDSYGGGGASQQTATYTLNYRVLASQAGAKRNLGSHYQTMVTLWATIADAIRVNDSTANAIHLQAQAPGAMGKTSGPDEMEFFGFDIGIQVTELIN